MTNFVNMVTTWTVTTYVKVCFTTESIITDLPQYNLVQNDVSDHSVKKNAVSNLNSKRKLLSSQKILGTFLRNGGGRSQWIYPIFKTVETFYCLRDVTLNW